MQFIEKETEGRVVLGPGTLYGAINNLISKGWLEGWGEEKNTRKKDYVITAIGKEIVNTEIKRLSQVYHSAVKIAGEGGHSK